MNAIGISLLLVVLALTAVGCDQTVPVSPSESISASQGSQEEHDPRQQTALKLTNDDWDLVLAEARGAQKAHVGSDVDIRGKVAQVMSASTLETQFTIETKMEVTFGERTLVVVGADPGVTEGQWVQIQGALHSYWNTQNLMGGELRLPVVAARRVVSITRADAFPASRAVQVDQSITQHGLTITLQRLEIADLETRLYVHAINNSPNKASLYAFDAVLVQGTQQIKKKDVFDQDLEEPDTTLVSGTETQGILLFESMSPDTSPVRLIWEDPRTDDYSLTFDDWEWTISW